MAFASLLGAQGVPRDAEAEQKDLWRPVDCLASGEHGIAWSARAASCPLR